MSEYLNRVRQIMEDDEQRAAFCSKGSRVVIAGPGSGKTYLLTTKVAKLLLEGELRYPRKITCITYSRQLADKLVKELRALGVYDTERLYVGTIHAFCIAEILMPAVNLLPPGSIPDPFRIASKEEMKKALSYALQRQGTSLKVSNKDLNKDLEKFRRRYFLPEENTFTTFPESNARQNVDWAELAEDYQEYLQQTSPASIDFVQVEMLALRILKTRPALAATLSAAYPWWFVDEYQDLSPLFHEMVKHLVEKKLISVFAIGDPNQCIYEELQGSTPRSIYELSDVIEKNHQTGLIKLQTNYRSPQNIIDLSDSLLGKNNGYQSNKSSDGEIHKIRVSDSSYSELVLRILNKIYSEINGSGLALLAPSRPVIEVLLSELEDRGLDLKPAKDPDFSSNTELLEWLQKLARWCSGDGVYFYELLPFWHRFCQSEGTDDDARRFAIARELFTAIWPLRDGDMLLGKWVDKVHRNVLTNERLDKFEKIRPDDAKEFRQLVEAVSTIERLKNKTVYSFGRTDARILITTFHSSKGLEFDAAIVIDLDSIRKWTSHDLSKRLAYVATSRAKTRLYVLVITQGEIAERLQNAPIKHWVYPTFRTPK